MLPREAGEIGLFAEIAGRHSLPLVPVGSGTGSRPEDRPGSLLVRFDLMRAMRLPQHGQKWVEVEPGTPWLHLDDVLLRRGMGLTVYPVAPSLVPANATREFFPSTSLAEKLGTKEQQAAVQGTVTRSGEVLLLTLMDDDSCSAP